MSDEYLIQTVVSDLRYLDRKLGPETTLDDVRRDSVVLRRLLVHSDLKRAWRAAGMHEKYLVTAPRIEYFLETPTPPGSTIDFLIAGGADVGGAEVGVGEMLRTPEPGARHELPPEVNPNEHVFTLEQFVESGSFYRQGRVIKRREVILYVSNKLGGAHLDFKRKRGVEQAFEILDSTINAIQIDMPGFRIKNAIHFEMLSIGQRLVRSADTKRLIQLNSSPSG